MRGRAFRAWEPGRGQVRARRAWGRRARVPVRDRELRAQEPARGWASVRGRGRAPRAWAFRGLASARGPGLRVRVRGRARVRARGSASVPDPGRASARVRALRVRAPAWRRAWASGRNRDGGSVPPAGCARTGSDPSSGRSSWSLSLCASGHRMRPLSPPSSLRGTNRLSLPSPPIVPAIPDKPFLSSAPGRTATLWRAALGHPHRTGGDGRLTLVMPASRPYSCRT